MSQSEAGKGDKRIPGQDYQEGHKRIWPSPRKPTAHVVETEPDERRPQCGDCNGTRRVAGKPCPTCAPTDDGPEDGGNGE